MQAQRIGIFGASFNPPTLGHRDVIEQVRQAFDRILLVPSMSHPFNKTLLEDRHRIAMLEIFVQFWWRSSEQQIIINNIEKDIKLTKKIGEPIYTYDVLTAIEQMYAKQKQPVNLFFIIGPDNAKPQVWQKFYRHQEIEQRWGVYVAQERIDIHSVQVRESIARFQGSRDLKTHLLELVDEKIADYIMAHHLYCSG